MENEAKKKNVKLIAIIAAVVLVCVIIVLCLFGGEDSNTSNTQTALQTFTLKNDENKDFAYTGTFYLENKVLYAVPTEKANITLGDDAKVIEGNKVYKVAENVDKFYVGHYGQAGYYEALYVSNGDLYTVTTYLQVGGNADPLAVTKTKYKNVKDIIECHFGDSVGHILINNNDQIIGEKYDNDAYVFYDGKTNHSVNNVDGDIITLKNVKITKLDDDYVKVSAELEYNGETKIIEYNDVFLKEGNEKDTTITFLVTKDNGTYYLTDY